MFDLSKMKLFFANKGFYSRLSLDTSQPAVNQKAHDLAKHMNDILKQLHVNLLMSQES